MKRIIILLSSVYILTGCGADKGSGPWANFKPLNEIDKNIEGYYNASLGKDINPKIDSPAIYVDFSDGLIQAFNSNNANRTMIRNAAEQFGINPKNVWWGLGQIAYSGIDRLRFENNPNMLKAKINDPNSYKDIYAPIEESLKRITASSNDALLITDFEEYRIDKTEEVLDFASKYFIDWIKKGNSITFKYSAYHEVNKLSKIPSDKNLYFIFFTFGKQNEESLVSQFTKSLQNTGIEPSTFELNNNPYIVSNDYGGNDNTGIANKTFAKWVNSNKNGLLNGNSPYEFIGVNKPWDESLGKYVNNIIEKEKGLFLSKLTLNAVKQNCFQLKKIGVNVYDVSEDYEKYARCKEAKNHIPVLIKNEKKDNVWDENSKKDPIIKECYTLNATEIKKDWTYVPTDLSSKKWPELFDLDKELFDAHLKNESSKIALNTVFHSNYKIKGVKKSDALIRVDYVIEETSPNIDSLKTTDFSWSSVIKKDNGINQSLYSALKRTLQEPAINPKGKIIYSYYIKFANTKK